MSSKTHIKNKYGIYNLIPDFDIDKNFLLIKNGVINGNRI